MLLVRTMSSSSSSITKTRMSGMRGLPLGGLGSRVLAGGGGQVHDERGALARVALGDDGPAGALDDALADREADARPVVDVTCVEALEDAEDLLGVLRLEADA